MKKAVHVWHLEITAPSRLKRTDRARDYQLFQANPPLPELARFLYVSVGAQWIWYMRLGWTWAEWQARYDSDAVQLWIAYQAATPVGYFELEQRRPGDTQICYFGLLPEFIGRGHGKSLLEDALDRAFALGGNRVSLHTCSLDHPNALSNYLGRGFTIFREEDLVNDLPDEPIQPWPGANKPAPKREKKGAIPAPKGGLNSS